MYIINSIVTLPNYSRMFGNHITVRLLNLLGECGEKNTEI